MTNESWSIDVVNILSKVDLISLSICSICLEVPLNPIAGSCKHIICKECADTYFKSSRRCPYCRSQISIPSIDKRRQDFAQSLMVRCSNHEDCEWTGLASDFPSHILNECTGFSCLLGCGFSHSTCKQLTRHMEYNDPPCPYRRTTCIDCGLTVMPTQMEQHHQSDHPYTLRSIKQYHEMYEKTKSQGRLDVRGAFRTPYQMPRLILTQLSCRKPMLDWMRFGASRDNEVSVILEHIRQDHVPYISAMMDMYPKYLKTLELRDCRTPINPNSCPDLLLGPLDPFREVKGDRLAVEMESLGLPMHALDEEGDVREKQITALARMLSNFTHCSLGVVIDAPSVLMLAEALNRIPDYETLMSPGDCDPDTHLRQVARLLSLRGTSPVPTTLHSPVGLTALLHDNVPEVFAGCVRLHLHLIQYHTDVEQQFSILTHRLLDDKSFFPKLRWITFHRDKFEFYDDPYATADSWQFANDMMRLLRAAASRGVRIDRPGKRGSKREPGVVLSAVSSFMYRPELPHGSTLHLGCANDTDIRLVCRMLPELQAAGMRRLAVDFSPKAYCRCWLIPALRDLAQALSRQDLPLDALYLNQGAEHEKRRHREHSFCNDLSINQPEALPPVNELSFICSLPIFSTSVPELETIRTCIPGPDAVTITHPPLHTVHFLSILRAAPRPAARRLLVPMVHARKDMGTLAVDPVLLGELLEELPHLLPNLREIELSGCTAYRDEVPGNPIARILPQLIEVAHRPGIRVVIDDPMLNMLLAQVDKGHPVFDLGPYRLPECVDSLLVAQEGFAHLQELRMELSAEELPDALQLFSHTCYQRLQTLRVKNFSPLGLEDPTLLADLARVLAPIRTVCFEDSPDMALVLAAERGEDLEVDEGELLSPVLTLGALSKLGCELV